MNFTVKAIPAKVGKKYIKKHHYTHGIHNGPMCYGLFDEDEELVGVCAFATPISENVRSYLFGAEHKDEVTELHRLHTKEDLPPNTLSWFVARALRQLKQDRPKYNVVVTFADSTEGHTGAIYRALNANFYGMSESARFYEDADGRLRHPRQNGVNISLTEARKRGWKPVKRQAKFRYFWIIGDKREKRRLMADFRAEVLPYPSLQFRS